MTLQAGHHAAYLAANRTLGTPRDIEYQLFSQITGALNQARDAGQFPVLARALHENRQLWTALAIDLASDDNGLPQKLRADLLSLAQFTFTHTGQILQREPDASVDALIDINTAIMKGLRGELPAPRGV